MQLVGFFKNAFVGFRHDLLLSIITFTSVLAFIPIFTYISFADDLKDKDKLFNQKAAGIVLLDRKDRPFFTFYQGKIRDRVSLAEIPDELKQAVIASEDKDFYLNDGFSFKAVIRAFVDNLEKGDFVYGGSTITQQLVKNFLLSPKKDFVRKYQEIILASEFNNRYSKDEILEMYLNTVYFGEGAFGVKEAAKTYFNKNLKDLDLAESSLLVGLLPAPSALSPKNNFNKAKAGQKTVLKRMLKLGYISKDAYSDALNEKIVLSNRDDGLNQIGAHFALMVRDDLVKKYGEETVAKSGFKVYTTLDLDWQRYAEVEVAKQVELLKKDKVTNGAAVVIDAKDGEIRALVGSKNWNEQGFGQVNIATSLRPPGSSFKPIVYLAGFEKGVITPGTILKDQPTTFKNDPNSKTTDSKNPNVLYKPQNYDHRFRGAVTARRALSNSLNVPSVEVLSKVGLGSTLDMARRLGISSLKDSSNYGLSLVLGTGEVELLELTNVYATFANQGLKSELTSVLKIEDKYGHIVYQYQPKENAVANPADVFLISSILSDEKSRSEVFGKELSISRPAAVKTGTTEDYKDAWTLGYTPSLAIGVWVGNNYNQQMASVAGSLGAAPIWRSLMEKFSEGTPVEKFNPPDGVVAVNSCVATASAQIEYYKKGTEPKSRCVWNTVLPTPVLDVYDFVL